MQEVGVILAKSGRQALSGEEVHGMLTALVCGPETVTPTSWFACVFPRSRSLKAVVEKAWFGKLVELMVESYDDILFSVRAGTFHPYLGEESSVDARRESVRRWCTGFLYGMHLHGEKWQSSTEEYIATLTAPVFYLASPGDLGGELSAEQKENLDSRPEELMELVRINVPKVFDFWNFGKKPELKKEFFSPAAIAPAE